MMAKNGPRVVREFTSAVNKQFGMHTVVLAAFVDADGDPSYTL